MRHVLMKNPQRESRDVGWKWWGKRRGRQHYHSIYHFRAYPVALGCDNLYARWVGRGIVRGPGGGGGRCVVGRVVRRFGNVVDFVVDLAHGVVVLGTVAHYDLGGIAHIVGVVVDIVARWGLRRTAGRGVTCQYCQVRDLQQKGY